jgi:acyl dehydratase
MDGGARVGESLLTDEVLAAKGRVLDERSAQVSETEFQRWAAAVEDLNPLYFDAEVAKAHGFRGLVMPPMFLSEVVNGITHLADLRPDGISTRRALDELPLPSRRVGGSQDVYFYEPVCAGDTLTVTATVADIEEKVGRSGPMIVITLDTTYVNQFGETVGRIVRQMIAR